MQPLENELNDCPAEEKENEIQKELHVLDKEDNVSNSNVFQVSHSLLLEDLSMRISIFIIKGLGLQNKDLSETPRSISFTDHARLLDRISSPNFLMRQKKKT